MRDLRLLYPAHPKDRGQWAELLFMATAVRLDLKVAKPYGDNARYDFIVESNGDLHRVQVKCTSTFRCGYYRCICCWSRRTAAATRRPLKIRGPHREAGPPRLQAGRTRLEAGRPRPADSAMSQSPDDPITQSPDHPIPRRPGGEAMRYTKRDVDFIAIYVIPDDSWFIIPVEDIHHKVLDLPPVNAAPRSHWHQFRDAWRLLGVDPDRCLTLESTADPPTDRDVMAADLTLSS